MIEEIKLISRSNNEISYPNSKWERLNRIYVTGILNLGLSDKVHFNKHNCPSLLKVIKLIWCIRKNIKSEFELDSQEGRIRIENAEETTIRIYKYRLNGTQNLITEKNHYSRTGIDEMLESIWNQIPPLSRTLRNEIAIELAGTNGIKVNKLGLRLGDRVRTEHSVKTERKGLISWIGYHKLNDIVMEYTTIVIDGKQHNKRYKPKELILNEYNR